MNHPPQISEAEWQVMEVLWQTSPLNANQVIDALGHRTDWKPNTVRTLLARLVKKGALNAEAEGNHYLYSPRFSREAHVGDESESFLSRVFGGAAKGLLVHFAESGKLTENDLNELKKILKRTKE
ncbi:MAG: BlaI/MecI/CopY family transcriptional regulator [Chthoniobacteraceae bacterium]